MSSLLDRLALGAGITGHTHYYSKESTRTMLFNKYHDEQTYLNLCALFEMRRPVRGDVAIRPPLGIDFGSTAGDLKRHLGRPSAVVSAENLVRDRVFLYRHMISGLKVKSEYHLNESGLFYFNHTFRDITPDYQRLVIDLVHQKYIKERAFDYRAEKIVDGLGHELIINQNVSISIDYIWVGSDACRTLLNEIERPAADTAMSFEEQCRTISAHL